LPFSVSFDSRQTATVRLDGSGGAALVQGSVTAQLGFSVAADGRISFSLTTAGGPINPGSGVFSGLFAAADHIATEAAIRDSGIPATILRNGWYTENYTGALGAAVQHGAIIGAAGEGRVNSAARKDYAEAIAVTALDASHTGKTYELAGDAAHSGADLATAVAQAAGKPVAYVPMSQGDYAKALIGFGLPEGFAKVLADSDARAGEGALADGSRTLSRLIGRPTTPIAETIAAAL